MREVDAIGPRAPLTEEQPEKTKHLWIGEPIPGKLLLCKITYVLAFRAAPDGGILHHDAERYIDLRNILKRRDRIQSQLFRFDPDARLLANFAHCGLLERLATFDEAGG